MYYATGHQDKTITVTAKGPYTVTFNTVPVTVQISDPDSADLATASVAHADNTGTFGPKTAVDGNGQITVQVLPGTSTFTAWDGTAYKTVTLAVTAVASTSISVS